MPIYRSCPHCPLLVRIANDLVGHRVRCSRCGGVFRVDPEAETGLEEMERLACAEHRLSGDNADLQRRVAAVRAFDGNWSNPSPNDAPAFRPLSERRAPIVAIVNLKGGVGKTTLTANLGATLWSNAPKRHVLLLDLDYQANLTQACLDRKTIARLRKQERLVETLFGERWPDAQTLIRCVEPILDDRQRFTEGAILAGDEKLGIHETQALNRWLVAPEQGDIRFRLRSLLHAEDMQRDCDFIFLDCPPRLTTCCINALTAADYVLIPVVLDERSTEGAPRLLRWLRERRATLFPGLAGAGIVANKTRGKTRNVLVNRERDLWSGLLPACHDAWPDGAHGFETVVPFFTEKAMARMFPACYPEVGPTFLALADELRAQIQSPVGVNA
jgi:cellulose biosynthesis protein BcsQ